MFLTVFLTGIGLSMDAFAVAICKGLKMQKLNYKQMGLIALFFGGFQALMPLIGWLLGNSFKDYIESFDPYRILYFYYWIFYVVLKKVNIAKGLDFFFTFDNL